MGGRVLLLAVAAAVASRLSSEDLVDPGLKVGISLRGSVGSMLHIVLVMVSRRGLSEACINAGGRCR